ncbi:acyl-CoA dehydrogenase [Streptomyces sp. BI20]|uniref:acyl-CoA dehydrogenase family protein n=1 Tax=Streptomyces sp. BI20 TaxID=3403460 RepID=UPI003C78F71C
MSLTHTRHTNPLSHESGGDPALPPLLFREGGADPHAGLHPRFRAALADPLFRQPEKADTADLHRLAYDRLRALGPMPDDPRALAAAHEWTAIVGGGAATVIGIHWNLFLGSLLDDRISPARDLTPYLSLDRLGTFLCTERGHGNDAAALRTTAAFDPERDEFVLHTPDADAQKYMPNTGEAGGPKHAVVAARLLLAGRDEGVFLFLTPLTDENGPLPGVRVDPLPDRAGSPVDHCVTAFDRVRLPRTALIQGPHGRLDPDGTLRTEIGSPRKRFLTAIRRVTTGKLCMGAGSVGAARAALAVAVRYAELREVSGRRAGTRVPLTAHRSHTARLLSGLAAAHAMTFLHREVVDRWTHHRPEDAADTERLVGVAKGWLSWRARDLVTEARERCGARGLFHANGLAGLAADTDGAITAEGDNLAVWCKAGAELLLGRALPEPGPRATGAEDLTDPAFLRTLFADVERDRQERARRDLRAGDPDAPFGRWDHASAAALDLVAVHATSLAADAFTAALDRAEPAERARLTDLCALFQLEALRPLLGELLLADRLTPDQARALPDTIRDLVARLAPHLGPLADSFDLPPEHLAALPFLTPADQGRPTIPAPSRP